MNHASVKDWMLLTDGSASPYAAQAALLEACDYIAKLEEALREIVDVTTRKHFGFHNPRACLSLNKLDCAYVSCARALAADERKEVKGVTHERFWIWLAWKLPKPLVKWCAVRLGAHATTGDYSEQIVPDLTLIEALGRW